MSKEQGDLLNSAWDVIVNVSWSSQTPNWREAAATWRDNWNASVEARPVATETTPSTSWCEACEQYLKVDNEIRTRALDSAVRLLGSSPLGGLVYAGTYQSAFEKRAAIIEALKQLAPAFERYIKGGDFDEPIAVVESPNSSTGIDLKADSLLSEPLSCGCG